MSEMYNYAPLNKISVKKANRRRNINEGRWTEEEHSIFIQEVLNLGIHNWKKVSSVVSYFQLEDKITTRNNCQIRSHFQKFLKKICSKYKLRSKNIFNIT